MGETHMLLSQMELNQSNGMRTLFTGVFVFGYLAVFQIQRLEFFLIFCLVGYIHLTTLIPFI